MSGNHPSELSPRQRMINMMYLVLTALLALNVSKEVLDSFFEVNKGVVRTTNNFSEKNNETYQEFTKAAELNPKKAGQWRDKALEVKKAASDLSIFIQEMKYNLVYKADGKKVYLGKHLDENGEEIEENLRKEIPFSELKKEEQTKNIAHLDAKSDRDASGAIFINTGKATELRNKIQDYKKLLLGLSKGNVFLQSNIQSTLATEDKIGKGGKGTQTWERYNFFDMPAVGALTLLSKMQSDVRNAESDIIKLLKENIDAGTLKFTDAEAIAISNSNFVLRGDSFHSKIFLSAKDTTQDPVIYVGEYDSLGSGQYEMRGEYETVRVVDGKGIFSKKAVREGVQNWGGLITIKTESGTKKYPFKGSYLVANKTAVISPVYMNILYQNVPNPLKISVPGFAAGDVTPRIDNGGISATKRSNGEYMATPAKKGWATVTLYANKDGKRTKMGGMKFKVKEVPDPMPGVPGAKRSKDGIRRISKVDLLAAGGVELKMKDFDFQGIKYKVKSFTFSGTIDNESEAIPAKGQRFNKKINDLIRNTKSGSRVTIEGIIAKRIDPKTGRFMANERDRVLDVDIGLEIK